MKDAPVCVVKDTLNEGEVGEAYINGPVFCRLNVEDKAHIYAEIDQEHSGCFMTSADRGYPVIWKADGKKEGEMCAVIMLQSPNGKEYDGPFAVSEVNKSLRLRRGSCSAMAYGVKCRSQEALRQKTDGSVSAPILTRQQRHGKRHNTKSVNPLKKLIRLQKSRSKEKQSESGSVM